MFVVQAFCLTLQQPLCLSKCCSPSNKHSSVSIEQFKTFLSPDDALSVNSVADGRGRCLEKLETIISKSWWTLCSWLTRHVYHLCPSPMLPPGFLFCSISWAQHSPGSIRIQVAAKWWIGMPAIMDHHCIYYPSHCLDQFGHHTLNMEETWSLVTKKSEMLLESCRWAGLGPEAEVESGLGDDSKHTRPPDILIHHWEMGGGRPAVLNLTDTSMLNSNTSLEACLT